MERVGSTGFASADGSEGEASLAFNKENVQLDFEGGKINPPSESHMFFSKYQLIYSVTLSQFIIIQLSVME